MTGYSRQSTFADAEVIEASHHNNEYNQLVAAFDETTGHAHDGTSDEGPVIGLIGDAGLVTPLNKVLIDTINDNIGFWVDVASSSVEQIIIQDGALLPVVDNDIDLGSASLEFKNGYFDGTVFTDALDLAGVSITGFIDDDTMATASSTTIASSESVKAYVDSTFGASGSGDLISTNNLSDVDNTATALSNLGGQPLDSMLTSLSALVDPNADRIAFWDDSLGNIGWLTVGTGLTLSGTTLSRNTINLASDVTGTLPITNGGTGSGSASGARTALGLAIGSDVQAFNSQLTALSSLTPTNGNFIVGDGANWIAEAGQTVLGSIGVTSTIAELNKLDGVTASTAEINKLAGLTSTTAELNILDGVTSTTAELNKLDGVTATTAELNYLDITTLGTQQSSKALTADANNQVKFAGTIETVFSITDGASVSLDPANGGIQTWTLGASRTPTNAVGAGEHMVLLVDDGSSFTITWPTMTWLNNGGAAPTLATTGYTAISLFNVGGTLYGLLLGDGA